jgi:hypothetical protein
VRALFDSQGLAAKEASLPLPDATPTIARVESLDWQKITNKLNELGNALLREILSPQDCESLASLYGSNEHFRSRVVMARHGFGRGEYKYFRYPLPEILQ